MIRRVRVLEGPFAETYLLFSLLLGAVLHRSEYIFVVCRGKHVCAIAAFLVCVDSSSILSYRLFVRFKCSCEVQLIVDHCGAPHKVFWSRVHALVRLVAVHLALVGNADRVVHVVPLLIEIIVLVDLFVLWRHNVSYFKSNAANFN